MGGTLYALLMFIPKKFYDFLAHLSRRLIGELIVYPWPGVRPSVHIFKDLLL